MKHMVFLAAWLAVVGMGTAAAAVITWAGVT